MIAGTRRNFCEVREPFSQSTDKKLGGAMIRPYYPSIFDELHEMRTYRDSLFRQMKESPASSLLPAAEGAVKMLPAPGDISDVDILDGDEDLVIRAYPEAGIAKKDVSIELINPRALRITRVFQDEITGETGGFYLHERTFGSLTRIIPLPCPVTEKGSAATFRDGVLEIHLSKDPHITGAKIAID
jgi:HSP20 family protein